MLQGLGRESLRGPSSAQCSAFLSGHALWCFPLRELPESLRRVLGHGSECWAQFSRLPERAVRAIPRNRLLKMKLNFQ